MSKYKITSKTVNGKLAFYIKKRAFLFFWKYCRWNTGGIATFNCYIKAKGYLNNLLNKSA